MAKLNDQLIEKCKQNDTAAKEWLYKTYAPVLLGVCLRYINNRMQAEDILQESFITVFEKIHQLKNNQAIEGWLKRIVVNNALIFLKKNKHDKDIDDLSEKISDTQSENEPKDIKEQILQLEVSQEQMLSLINEMPTGFRTVFNLYVFEKLKHSEIAQQLGISEGTSKSQLLRARKLLQKNLHALVKEKQKSRKKETVYLSSFILVMDDGLGYIDKLAQSKLEGFSIPPITGAEFIASTASVQSGASVAGIKGKLLTVVGKKVVWLSSTIVATAGLTTLFLTQQPSEYMPITPIEHSVPAIAITDSVENIENDLPMQIKVRVPYKVIRKRRVKVQDTLKIRGVKKNSQTIKIQPNP